eukprot:Gb_12289 [translate_table: standard]
MQHVFALYKLWGYITGKIAKPNDTEPQSVKDAYQENLDNAFAIINLVIITTIKINIKKRKTPKDGWDTLSNLYAGSNDAKIIQLRAPLGSLKMSLNDSIVEHLQKLKEVRNQLEEVGETIADKEMILGTIISLPMGRTLES